MKMLYLICALIGFNCSAMDDKESPRGSIERVKSLGSSGSIQDQFPDLMDSIDGTKQFLQSRRQSQERIDVQKTMMAMRMRQRSQSMGSFDDQQSFRSNQDQ